MDKYKYCFFMGFQKAVEYRIDFLLSLVSSIFPIIIQVSLWTAIYHSTRTGILYGYTYHQMIIYTFMVGLIGKFLATGFEYEINEDIKNGGLNKYIIKPINYYIYRFSCFLGERVSIFLILLILFTIIFTFFIFIGYSATPFLFFIFFVVSLMFTLILNFSIYFCVGMTGFWMSEISRLFPAIGVVLNVISGGIFPLDILGNSFNKIIFFLPFKYMLQFPVDIITGKMKITQIIPSISIQLFWIIFFLSLANWLWKKGLKKYIAVGG